MSLQTIPGDILLGILQHVSSWTNYRKVDFKQQLKVMALFQRLRTIALPKIYSHVYITFGDEDCKSKSYSNKYSETFAKYVDTNVDIIALTNCTHMVKSVKIDVYGLSRSCAELYNTNEALKSCASTWPNITKLTMSMRYKADYNYHRRFDRTLFPRMGNTYCGELANIMPCVTELTLLNNHSKAICEFYSHVVGAYAGQVVKLTNECGFDYTHRHRFEVLQYLNLTIGYFDMLPSVNCHTLVDLHIEDISVDVSWVPFMDSKNNTVIEFTCLKRLWLQFNFEKNITYNEKIQHCELGLTLNFPELISMNIICDSSICPFFEMARFPDVMENISIQAPQELLEKLEDAGMPYCIECDNE